jgi:hypothetical protein
MHRIQISTRAKTQILSDQWSMRQISSMTLSPRLVYSYRIFSRTKEGQTVEHGDGIALSFIDPACVANELHIGLDLGDGISVFVGPSNSFKERRCLIDWTGAKFVARFKN